MAAPTNAVTTLNSKGNREDLEDVIYKVAAEETPFISNISKVKATAIQHDWQTSGLATPDPTNAQLEGDDATIDAGNLTTRLSNTAQIFRKTGAVSETQEVVNKAGRDSEVTRQKVEKLIELRRDMEARFIGNYANVATESGSTSRKAAGALAWLTSNVSRGSGGASGGFSSGTISAATNGTLRTMTEDMIKAAMLAAFNNGAKPNQAYMGGALKQKFSTFTGIAQYRVEHGANPAKNLIVGAADVYVSDFGNLTLIPHAYALTRDVLIADPKLWAVATLRGAKTEELAKTGDSTKYQIVTEATLVSRNEKGSAVVADVQAS